MAFEGLLPWGMLWVPESPLLWLPERLFLWPRCWNFWHPAGAKIKRTDAHTLRATSHS